MKKSFLLYVVIIAAAGLFLAFGVDIAVLKKSVNTLLGREHRYWQVQRTAVENGKMFMEITSPAMAIDTIYRSMMGPYRSSSFSFLEDAPEKLLWLTGYSVQIVGKDGEASLSDDFLCHNNFNYLSNDYLKKWGLPERVGVPSPKRITLASGQMALEFPDGFGIPVKGNERAWVIAQVLNLNNASVQIDARQKAIVELEEGQAFKPLYQQTVQIVRPVAGEVQEYAGDSNLFQSCSPAHPVPNTRIFEDGDMKFTGHWVMPMGREILRTDVTEMLNLPFSTTLHYISVHMHPFAEWLEFRDATADSTIFKARAKNYTDKIGLEKLDYFSSETGVMLQKDHQYELVCSTNNTSGEQQDMMAVMYLYIHDKELEERIRDMGK